MNRIEIVALPGLPAVAPGDDLAALIGDALERAGVGLGDGDVVVVAQKVVSKAEGRRVDLATVRPSARAEALASRVLKDPRLVELILSESVRVVRSAPNLLIVEHRLGFVMANAGIDQSNTAPADAGEFALLLPIDPAASARRLRAALRQRFGAQPAVVVNDSFGRPWRRGTVGVALGTAGLPALLDLRGRKDLFGRALQSTQVGHADEIAAAASLMMGQAAEARPAVLIRGLTRTDAPDNPVSAMLRPPEEDQFR
jgi:coenzyme F420-0:L-glutamate ligase/coenzyme F420-1:gamma-L-glutamate ligase